MWALWVLQLHGFALYQMRCEAPARATRVVVRCLPFNGGGHTRGYGSPVMARLGGVAAVKVPSRCAVRLRRWLPWLLK